MLGKKLAHRGGQALTHCTCIINSASIHVGLAVILTDSITFLRRLHVWRIWGIITPIYLFLCVMSAVVDSPRSLLAVGGKSSHNVLLLAFSTLASSVPAPSTDLTHLTRESLVQSMWT